jgi:demethylmenaquinone methyltransferase/2-methoxy-6-polyprenyl-1,4-benzoquinol methylase
MTDEPIRPATTPLAASPRGDAVVPHGVLAEYYPEESKRRRFLDDIFDRTSGYYDRTEKLIGLGTGSWYRRQALLRAGLAPGMRVVDVGVGTGLVARQAVRIVGDPALVTGVDPSAGMMSHAHLPAGVSLLRGTGEAIPLADASADFLSMGFALRHLSSLDAAFAEFHRVMKPGAHLCLLEITRPRGRFARALLKTYMKWVVPAIARLWADDGQTFRIWRYYWETIEACVEPETVMRSLREAGFVDVERAVEVGIFSEYRARRAG